MSFTLYRKKTSRSLASCRVRRVDDVLATRQGEELVLLDPRGERYYTLNDVGAVAWAALAKPVTCNAVVEAILQEFDMPAAPDRATVEADVAQLIEQLVAARLVSILPEPPTGAT